MSQQGHHVNNRRLANPQHRRINGSRSSQSSSIKSSPSKPNIARPYKSQQNNQRRHQQSRKQQQPPKSAPHRHHNHHNNQHRHRLSQHTSLSTRSSRHSSKINNNNKLSIPRLPRIKRLSLEDEIKLASKVGMNGMTSHNIASIVNVKSQQTSNFFTDFIWEDDVSTVIDSTPPSYLATAARRKITPCRSRRVGASNTKLTPFKSMSQLSSHRFHLAELFQNDGMFCVFKYGLIYFYAMRFCDFSTSRNITTLSIHSVP